MIELYIFNSFVLYIFQFVRELARVAAPGATIIIVTWCHRNLSESEKSLKADEIKLLDKICDAYYLPAWCSANDYVNLLQSLQLHVRTSYYYYFLLSKWVNMLIPPFFFTHQNQLFYYSSFYGNLHILAIIREKI